MTPTHKTSLQHAKLEIDTEIVYGLVSRVKAQVKVYHDGAAKPETEIIPKLCMANLYDAHELKCYMSKVLALPNDYMGQYIEEQKNI